ncbi:DNA polymerase IV [Thalassotalea ganghwensis]
MRKIIHIDMDCFYAAVEMRDNPEYRNIPIAVGGNSARGVLCTCNYLAREFGVRSAMPNHKAKALCPDLVIVNGRMSVYQQVSKEIQQIFQRYTPIIEPLSLDEAYLDVTDCQLHNGSATLIAQQIRDEIHDVTGLTASAGIAPLKFVAKIASDLNKPNGQCTIAPNEVHEFLEGLSLNQIPGVGKVTFERLKSRGFHTCGDVRRSDERTLINWFGKYGGVIWRRSNGVDEREVTVSRERKSVGVERTFEHDLSNLAEMEKIVCEKLIPELKRRAEKYLTKRAMNKIGVKVKFNDFQQTTKEQSLTEIDVRLLVNLLREAVERGQGKAVRLLGVHIGLAKPNKGSEQISFDW